MNHSDGLPEPLRLLFVVARGDAFGGSSLHVADLSRRLVEDGHQVRILVGGNEHMEVPKRFRARGLDFLCIPEMGREIRLGKDLPAILRLRTEIRNFSPDIVSLHSSKAGGLGRIAAFGLGVPVLYTPHCWSFVEGFPRAGFYRSVERLLAPLATRLVTVSEDERECGLRAGVGRPSQTLTIHNGVHDAFESEPADPLSRQPLRLLMVGRFEEQKDQRLLIQALAELASLDWSLTLVGDGPMRPSCEQFARDLGLAGRVVFAGYSDRVEEHLRRHDVFLLISKWEGFPRSILEAMSASLPIVASDVGGARESVADGINGRLVAPGEAVELTAALAQLITDRRTRVAMAIESRRRYQKEFTFERMFSRYRNLYYELANRRADGDLAPEEVRRGAPAGAMPRAAEGATRTPAGIQR